MSNAKVSLRFVIAIALAVSSTLFLPILLAYLLVLFQIQPRWWFEVFAWLFMMCTYCGFILTEPLGPQGLKRLPKRQWRFGRLYLAVYSSTLGVVCGLAILLIGVRGHLAFPVLAAALVIYHFVVRHLHTEARGTPHLGQGAEPSRARFERLLGQAGDLALAAVFYFVYAITSHPIWWFGVLILTVGYMVGVWIHAWLDPEAESSSSYPAVLACLLISVGAVLWFGFLKEITRLDAVYANAFLAALVGVSAILVQTRTVAAFAAGGGLAFGTLYGLLVSNENIPTSFETMLLNSSAPPNAVTDYSIFLFVGSCAMNVFRANLNSVYRLHRGNTIQPGS